jgi:hypothetical protein
MRRPWHWWKKLTGGAASRFLSRRDFGCSALLRRPEVGVRLKGEVAHLEQKLVRVDGEVVELGGDSMIRWSEREEGGDEEQRGAGGGA